MRARPLVLAALLLAALTPSGAAVADEDEDAARKATNPLALTNTLQAQPAYTDVHAGGNSTQLLVRLGLAYRYFLLPGLRLGDTYTFARLEMYGEALDSPSKSVVGLQDWGALLLGIKPFAWGAIVGVGVDAMLPTATNPALGSQQLQLGPAAGALVTHVRPLQLGVLVQAFFSVTGTPDLAYLQVQPIIVWHLPKALFLKSDGILKFDFEKAPRVTAPVNLHFGHAFTSHLAISAITEVVTTGSGVGNVTLQLNINYLAW
jgi:hypothetical protein